MCCVSGRRSFLFLRPRHSPSRHRSYDARDIDTLKLIKRLLHAEGSLSPARKSISANKGLIACARRVRPNRAKPGRLSHPYRRMARPQVAWIRAACARRSRKSAVTSSHCTSCWKANRGPAAGDGRTRAMRPAVVITRPNNH